MRLILNTYLIHLLNIKCKVTVFLYEQKTYSQLFLFHSPFRNKANCGEYRIVDVFHCILLIARNILIINANWIGKMTKGTNQEQQNQETPK